MFDAAGRKKTGSDGVPGDFKLALIVKAVQKEQIAPFEPCGDYIGK